jgi:hypothetical protein
MGLGVWLIGRDLPTICESHGLISSTTRKQQNNNIKLNHSLGENTVKTKEIIENPAKH